MPRYYLDSSALVKRYHNEAGSELVRGLIKEPTNRVLTSRLAIVEVDSGTARLVREQALSQDDFDRVTALLRADVASGIVQVFAVSPVTLDSASDILRSIGVRLPLRSLDAIHAATAHRLHQRQRLTAFVASDARLLSTAEACGLPVLDVGK